MSGIEQNVVPELIASLTSQQPLPSQVWRTVWNQAPDNLNSGKSGNQSLVALATAYIHNEPGAADCIREFLRRSRSMWMGTEQDSTVYGEMHLVAVGAIAKHAQGKDADIAAEALSWLAMWHGVGEACRHEASGRMLTVGDRSGDRDPEPDQIWRAWIRALAAGEDRSNLEARGHQLGLGMGQSWIRTGCLALQDVLSAAWQARSTSGWALLDPIHILTWPDGSKAVYKPKSNNGNTPGLLAACALGSPPVFSYLPPDGGSRARGQADQATCSRQGDMLVYDSAPFGHHEIELPAGDPLELLIGVAGAQAPPAPPPGGPAVEPQPPASGPAPTPEPPPSGGASALDAPMGGREWFQKFREVGS